jgi:hypothetical protein
MQARSESLTSQEFRPAESGAFRPGAIFSNEVAASITRGPRTSRMRLARVSTARALRAPSSLLGGIAAGVAYHERSKPWKPNLHALSKSAPKFSASADLAIGRRIG